MNNINYVNFKKISSFLNYKILLILFYLFVLFIIGLKILKDPKACLDGRVYVSKIEKLAWLVYCSFYFLHPRIWKKPKQDSKAVLHESLCGLPGL